MYDELRPEPGPDAVSLDCEAEINFGSLRAKTSSPQLNRNVFKTSRLLEFCSVKELTLQTGHPIEQWPLAIAKELLDNSLDACEGAQIAPNIAVTVQTCAWLSISVKDNGPGISPETVAAMLDFSVRASSNEAYASPTRGAQGNAPINNPFRQLGGNGESLDSFLEMQRVGRHEPVILLVHLASPRIAYTDRGKSALALGGAITSADHQQDEEEFEE